MEHSVTTSELVTRMSRVHTPEHHIALKLGLPLKTLRTLYGPAMQHAKISADLEVRETLFAMARSGKHPAVTIFWFKTFSNRVPENPLPPKNLKQSVRPPMPPYGAVRFVGPNGEIVT